MKPGARLSRERAHPAHSTSTSAHLIAKRRDFAAAAFLIDRIRNRPDDSRSCFASFAIGGIVRRSNEIAAGFMRLKDKVALISGSGSGIGEATAKRLAAEGAAVVVVDLNEEGARRVTEEIRSAGGTAEALKTNIAIPTEVEGMIKFAVAKFGQLDILHNNAIRLYTGRVGEMPL